VESVVILLIVCSGIRYVTGNYNWESLEGSRQQKCNRDICVSVVLGFTNKETHEHLIVRTYIYTHICIPMYTYTHINMYINTHIHTHTLIDMCTHIRTYTNTHTYIHTYIYVRTYARTHPHTHTHKYGRQSAF